MAGWCCKKFDVGAKVVSPFPADVAALSATSCGGKATCCQHPAWVPAAMTHLDALLVQHGMPGSTATRSPNCRSLTPGPTSTTVPADSWPGEQARCQLRGTTAPSVLLCPAEPMQQAAHAATCLQCRRRERLSGSRLTNDHGLPDNEVSNPPTPPVCSTALVSQQQHISTRVAKVQTACCWPALRTQLQANTRKQMLTVYVAAADANRLDFYPDLYSTRHADQ